jgi:protein phosphatase
MVRIATNSILGRIMSLEFYSATDVGRSRANNEDSVVVDDKIGLAILADGMGGYKAGEVASEMLTGSLNLELGRCLKQAGRTITVAQARLAIEACVDNANRAIFTAAQGNPQFSGMGTTLVLGLFCDEGLLLGHVGDSRAYCLREGRLTRMTRDHSLLQQQIDAGLLNLEEAAFSNIKNLLTRAVGVEEAVRLELHLHQVHVGDVFLLCSDGLTDMLSEPAICGMLVKHAELADAGRALIDGANEMGGRDNISVIAVRVGPGWNLN